MTPLPERKKTAEELAELRESLGVPDQLPPGAPGAAGRERVELPKAKAKLPTPADEAHGAEPGGAEQNRAEPEGAERSKSASPEAGVPAGAPSLPKPVRSLKRSEREPRKVPQRKRAPRKKRR